MKKTILIASLCVMLTPFAMAQSTKMYVSRQGGTKKFFTFGQMGYNSYRFDNSDAACDTLICRGSGFEKGTIDRHIIDLTSNEETNYTLFNKALRATEKQIRRTKSNEGQFHMEQNNKMIRVTYSNADSKGNMDVLMEVM